MSKFGVLLSSASSLWSQGLERIFSESNSFSVMGQVHPDQLLETAQLAQPDVILLKLDQSAHHYPLEGLREQCPFSLMVVIMENPNQYNISEFIHNGVRGCLPARLFPRQIVKTVELIVEGGIVCLPRMGQDPQVSTMDEQHLEKMNLLTGREHEVLALLGRSYSNQEIANCLSVSESTVKTHIRNIFKKLEVRNRTEALLRMMKYEQFHVS